MSRHGVVSRVGCWRLLNCFENWPPFVKPDGTVLCWNEPATGYFQLVHSACHIPFYACSHLWRVNSSACRKWVTAENGSLCYYVLHNLRKLVEVCQFSLGRTIFMIILREHLPAFLRWVLAFLLYACAVFIMFCAHVQARKWKLDFMSFIFQI